MFITKKVNKNVVAVMDNYPPSIYLRKSGKQYYGKEIAACVVKEDKVIINKRNIESFGLEIEIID